MARLFGVVLPDDKRIEYALTLIYGIGWSTADKVLVQAKINKDAKVGKLGDENLKKIATIIEKNFRIEGNLREEINENIKRLKDIRCYRGFRHMAGLPVKGQRTKSNSRTKRGKRRTVGALKKEDWTKMQQQGSKTK